MKKGKHTACCGWWGFPHQTYHEARFPIPFAQTVEITADTNVTEVRIYKRQIGFWSLVWVSQGSGKANLLPGEYKAECGRSGPWTAKACITYSF